MEKESCTIEIYLETLFKIIGILEKYTETLDTFEDIEEVVNVIHYIQEQAYLATTQGGSS